MSFQGIHTSYSAIRAAQAQIATTSHNIANATTPGYTRQRVDTVGRDPYQSPSGTLGQGVDIAGIGRQRDVFLDQRARTESARLSGMEARSDLLTRAEVRLGELDAGIDVSMSNLFAQLEELALHPESSPVRSTVMDAMDEVASRIRTTSAGISDLQSLAIGDVQDTVAEANTTIDALAAMNGQIASFGGKDSPNDLLDRRDALLDQLSSSLGATVIRQDNGHVRVSLNGLSLVDGTNATHLAVDPAGVVTHPDGPISAGGRVGGLRQFLSVDLPGIQAQFDQLATDLATAFNNQNAAGFVASGAAGGALFDASGGASQLRLVATSGADIAAGSTSPPGAFDGTNAQALADLRTFDTGSGTLLERYRNVATNLGVEAARASADVRSQAAMESTSSMARESQHGVSLDEEFANLIAYQRALEAAARVMSAMDEALSTLINRTGVVGR